MPWICSDRLSSAIKYDNAYPRGRSELDRFLHDAEAIGIKVNLSGDLPEQEELRHVMILAMRECLTNSVRHAGATTIHITAEKKGDSVSVKITNDGRLSFRTSQKNRSFPKPNNRNLIILSRLLLESGFSHTFLKKVLKPVLRYRVQWK
ncbi:MAG: hypothetical protein MR936_14715 [Eubacterium sp.]|nr:hypothetical protein [Eubacterium sp.]